jgi:FkbM family methyltransferase
VQAIVRSLVQLTGRGGGKFAQLLPPGETFLIQNYFQHLKFQVDTTYPMEATTWLAGVYDPQTTRFLKAVIQPGDVVLDVGANCGALTLVAASLVANGRVYAFEPSPTIWQRLQTNINLNPIVQSQVQVLPLGLGATHQQLLYYEDPNYPGNGALHQTQGDPVDVVPLDEWVTATAIPKIDVIKIDVEGMEYEVLMGAKATLTRFQPLLYFETLPIFFTHKPYTVRSLYEFLIELDYRIHYPQPPYAQVPLSGPYPTNSVAVHLHHQQRLPSS